MELVESIFAQVHADIQSRLKLLERQVIAIVANANRENVYSQEVKEDVQRIKDAMKAFQERVNKLENNKLTSTPITSAGLEGMLVRPLSLPSPILPVSTSNSVIMPMRNLVINEVEEDNAEPDEEAMAGELAEQMGGIDNEQEEEQEEEQQEEDEQEDEQEEEQEEEDGDQEEDADDEDEGQEEEVEVVEIEEFIWKGKTYGKSSDHKVYKLNEKGDLEDEPFAEYDPKTNRLFRI